MRSTASMPSCSAIIHAAGEDSASGGGGGGGSDGMAGGGAAHSGATHAGTYHHTHGSFCGVGAPTGEFVSLPGVGRGVTSEVRGYTHVVSRQDIDLDTPALIPFAIEHPAQRTSSLATRIPCCLVVAIIIDPLAWASVT